MARPLNIVWMCADHQAYANRPEVAGRFATQTRLAREGLRFARAYTVLPICTPSRASMLTGLYPHAHGITENDGRFGGRPGLGPGDWLVNGPLAEAGYRCAWFGKWHLNKARSAQGYGFEGCSLPGYGFPYGTAAYRDYLERTDLAPPIATIEIPGESGRPAGTRVPLAEADDWFDHEAGSAVLEGSAEAHEAFFVAHLAEIWLDEIGDEPFFLRVDPWGPHPPYVVAPPFLGLMDNLGPPVSRNLGSSLDGRPEHHRAYRDYWTRTLHLNDAKWLHLARRALEHVALVEAALARVLDALDRNGLADHTLVIFCADHGDAVASNGGVANKGGLMVEETMGIPLLVRMPGAVGGVRSNRLVANIDIAPTILEACGLDVPAELHGRSLLPLLLGRETDWRDGLLTEHYGLHEPIAQRAYYEGGWKLVVQEDGFVELYDLGCDPCELSNLAACPRHVDRLARMRAGLRQAMEATGDSDQRLARIFNEPAR